VKAAALAALLAFPALAHDVITTKITFSREISRLFAKRCLGCHRPGGPPPMSLAAYEEARPWAKAIKEEVLERRMPQWGAVKGFGAFANDGALTQEEVSLIAEWVEGGAPEGETKYLPHNLLKEGNEPKPVVGRTMRITGGRKIAAPALLVGIQPQAQAEVKSVRVYADLPDGRIEPLLWLRGYKPEWRRVFELRRPLALAPGARIRVEPEGQAAFLLITKK
jgi:hypothetical protein